jgi:hypothetical protein
MADRVEVTVTAWGNISFGVHRVTTEELTELRKIRTTREFVDRLLTVAVRYWRDGVKVWGDDWQHHTCHNLSVPAPSAYSVAELEPLLTAALEINALTLPQGGLNYAGDLCD